jgi:hypothetical protein
MWKPTLIVDEADTILIENEPLRAVINSGHTRGQGALRCEGDDHTPRLFPTFCPKALGMKGRKLPDTTLSRCIIIEMRRKKPGERAEHFKHIDDAGLAELRSQCLRWSIDSVDALKVAEPELPAGFDNRLGDNWRLLLAIADHAGGGWPAKARQAAINISKVVAAADASIGVSLLADIKTIFEEKKGELQDDQKGGPRMPSGELAALLGATEGRPWSEWKGGKPITANQLARLLAPFKVVPDSIRVGDKTPKGYYRSHFEDAFIRYLGDSETQHRNNASAAGTSSDFQSATDDPCCGSKNDDLSHSPNGCCGVAVQKPESGECEQCGGLKHDAPLVIEPDDPRLPPEGVYLHRECRNAWLRSQVGICVLCGRDAPLVFGDDFPPRGIHLHPECRRPWLRRQ